METKIIAIIILCVVIIFAGATSFIYWGSRINEWRNVFKKVMAEVEAEQANAAQEEKTKEPIDLAWVKRYLTVPFILLAVFVAEYIAVSSLLDAKRVEFLFLFVFAMLAMVVLEALGIDKKVPRVRFWMHLGVAMLFEICFVMDVYLLLSGYYFEDGLRLKRIVGAIAGIFLFFAEAYRAQHDWYAVLDAKNVDDNNNIENNETEIIEEE